MRQVWQGTDEGTGDRTLVSVFQHSGVLPDDFILAEIISYEEYLERLAAGALSMSDHDHVQACAAARLQGLKTFFLARGHSADEADDLAKRHLRGETVAINEPPGEEPKES